MTISSTGGGRTPQIPTLVDAPIGPAGDDRLVGTPGADTIFGGLGRDSIFGRGGRDLLNGEDGNDRVFGEAGNDQLLGDIGNDQLLGGIGHDRLLGGIGNDVLNGGIGNDILNGGLGVDRLRGQAGNDVYVVNHIRDAVFEGVDNGHDRVFSSVSHTLAANVEELQLTGTASINGVGNELDNVLSGNLDSSPISNRLVGGLGNDRLFGYSGEDFLIGGRGNDLLSGGGDNDRLAGGLGNDVYIVDAVHERVIERAGEGTDTVYTNRNEVLQANVENLLLLGTRDAFGVGNAEDNVLRGNAGRNVLSGGVGDDELIGAGGSDTLFGGAGADTFVFNALAETPAGAERDVVRGFQPGVDTIDLTGTDADAMLAGDQAFTYIGGAAFSGVAGELRYADNVVSGDLDGDGVVDMQIAIANNAPLTVDDFLL